MPLPVRLVLAGGAGAVLALAFEPFGLAPLLPLGVAALCLLLGGVSPGRGAAVGTVFGTTFMLLLLPWLQVIGYDAWIALSLLEGLFYGVLGALGVLVRRLPWWPVWMAALWVGVEALRGTVPFGGFPWGRLAFATADTPVAALVAYVGVPGTSFVVALLGGTLAWVVLSLRTAPLRATGVLVAAAVAVGAGALLPPSPVGTAVDRTVRVAAVQGDVPGEGMAAFAERRAVLDNHVDATHELAARVSTRGVRPDLVIWPENSTDIDPFADPTVHEDIQGAVDAIGVPVLVGAMVSGDEPGDVFNQGIVWEPGSGPGERYSKTHPVPFGEYIPLRDLFAPYFERLEQIPRDMVPGSAPGVLDVGGVTLGDVICFEVAYDGLIRDVISGGAELLVVQTNNATYMGTGQIEQQFAISRLRAIETGRYVVVAATNGVSGIIAPTGVVVERAPVRTRAVLEGDLPVLETLTPAVRWGSAVEVLLVAVGALAALAALVRGRRRRERSGRTEPSRAEMSKDVA